MILWKFNLFLLYYRTSLQDTEEGTTSMDEDIKLITRADIAFQESLQSEVEPDPMEGEQTWPTDEELREAEGLV